MKNLLTLTFRYYAALAGLLWLLSIPLSYGLIQRLVVQDVDEALLARKTEIRRLLTQRQTQLLRYLPQTDPDVHLQVVQVPSEPSGIVSNGRALDRLYDTTYYLPLLNEWEPHRELATSLRVDGHWYRLLIRQSLVEREDFILTITGLQTGVFLLLLLGLGLINRQMTRRLWQPFTDALHRIQQFRLETDPAPLWPPTQVAEFGELHQALTTLINRNQAAYSSQKQFTENASHEMQTPLAIITAELEVLFQTEHLPDQELGHVQRATEAAHRLSQINKALLLLTQIENQQFTDTQPVNIGTLVSRMLNANSDFIEHKQLILTCQQTANPAVQLNPQLAEVLLGNLIRNAIRHTPMGGRITCTVQDESFVMVNTGKPLPFPPGSLFDRFIKNPALPEATGLGLAIARQIANRYGLTLTYAYDDAQQTHQFTLGFTPTTASSELHQH